MDDFMTEDILDGRFEDEEDKEENLDATEDAHRCTLDTLGHCEVCEEVYRLPSGRMRMIPELKPPF